MASYQGVAGTLVDIFSCAGGFSLGAELAGFHSIAAIDIDGTLQSGYRLNFPATKAVEADVRELGPSEWRYLIGSQRPSGVVGGPPCQGFSPIGRRKSGDPRNSLISSFINQVNILQPSFFVFENVEGLLQPENKPILDRALSEVNNRYVVLEPLLVSAADYGAATTRRRVVVVGYDPDEIDQLSHETFAPTRHEPPTVRDAISDLPSPVPMHDDSGDFDWAEYPEVETVSSYAAALRAAPPAGLGAPEAIRRLALGQLTGLTETRHSEAIAKRYAEIAGGKSDPTTKSYKLKWDGQCPTLRAGTGSDRGAFQAVRPLHPSEGRVITVREAARLQGFPDWFLFHPTKWHSFRMIGNSVSPPVSRVLFERIASKMHVALAA